MFVIIKYQKHSDLFINDICKQQIDSQHWYILAFFITYVKESFHLYLSLY